MTKKEFVIKFCMAAGAQDCRNYSILAYNKIITTAENMTDKLYKLNYLDE